MSFDQFKAKPMQRFTSSLWNSFIDALNRLDQSTKEEILKRVRYEDLQSLAYSIMPDQPNVRDLGSSDKQWKDVYASTGYFSNNVYIQGKPAIKDGDPINIADIFDTARDKITQAINNAVPSQRLDIPLSQIARESTLQSIGSRIDVNLSTRASETTLQNIVTILNTILPTLSRESTLQDARNILLSIGNAISEIGSLVLLDYSISPLQADAQWTSTVDDSPYTSLITGYAISDVPGTLYVEQSGDGVNWDVVDTYNVAGGQATRFHVEKVCQYARVRYVNGPDSQSVFRIYVYRRLRAV